MALGSTSGAHGALHPQSYIIFGHSHHFLESQSNVDNSIGYELAHAKLQKVYEGNKLQ